MKIFHRSFYLIPLNKMKALKPIALLAFLTFGLTTVKADPIPLPVAIKNVTKAYLAVKNALVAGNAATAQAKAMDLVSTFNSVPDVNMNMDQHRMWFEYLSKMVVAARKVNEDANIEHQRSSFADLSENLFTVLKKFHMNSSTLYYQYSSYDHYYWISETAAIKNPYSGPGTSLTKGETRETLSAGR